MSSSTSACVVRNESHRALPWEVWLTVFEYLSSNDRKAVKLVCKSWLEMCDKPSLLNKEVLNCLGIYQSPDIFALLDRSQRSFLSVYFECVRFHDDSVFWSKNGPRIRSMHFENCHFYDGFLERIVVDCEKLTHLSIVHTDPKTADVELQPLIVDLERLAIAGIVRENLNTLLIRIESSSVLLLRPTYLHLMRIFPKVKALKLHLSYFEKHKMNADETEIVLPTENPTFAPVLDYVSAYADQIESLDLHFRSVILCLDNVHRLAALLIAMKRLDKLAIYFVWLNFHRPVIESALVSKPLKSLVYEFQGSYFETFLSELLISNSHLTHLTIKADYSLKINKRVFDQLMSSGLKSLKVYFFNGCILIDDDPESSDSSAENRSSDFPKLSFRVSYQGETYFESFLKNFQNIHSLLIYNLPSRELARILKYQKKLKSLIVTEKTSWEHRIQDVDEAISRNIFSSLNDLENLDLSDSLAYFFLSSLSPGKVLENLKYLNITSLHHYAKAKKILPTDILKLAESTPFLECLNIQIGLIFPGVVLKELLSRLNQLRYFRCLDFINFDHGDDVKVFFLVCPWLRVAYYHLTSAFFDTINKRIVYKGHLEDKVHFALPPGILEDNLQIMAEWLKF